MPALYVDTSALVKRYVVEVGSAWVRRALARPVHQVIYTAALTQAEVISALQRLVREGRLDTVQAQRLTQRVTRHFARPYQVLRITRPIVTQACAALEAHPLRAYDAVCWPRPWQKGSRWTTRCCIPERRGRWPWTLRREGRLP